MAPKPDWHVVRLVAKATEALTGAEGKGVAIMAPALGRWTLIQSLRYVEDHQEQVLLEARLRSPEDLTTVIFEANTLSGVQITD